MTNKGRQIDLESYRIPDCACLQRCLRHTGSSLWPVAPSPTRHDFSTCTAALSQKTARKVGRIGRTGTPSSQFCSFKNCNGRLAEAQSTFLTDGVNTLHILISTTWTNFSSNHAGNRSYASWPMRQPNWS